MSNTVTLRVFDGEQTKQLSDTAILACILDANGNPVPLKLSDLTAGVPKKLAALVGSDATALNHLALAGYAEGDVIPVVVPGRGMSWWQKTLDSDTPVTDVDAGILVTTDHDADIMPYHLVRVGGY